jgi:hypothetical protein
MEILNHLVESNFLVNFKLNKGLKQLYVYMWYSERYVNYLFMVCLSSETGRSQASALSGRRITEL